MQANSGATVQVCDLPLHSSGEARRNKSFIALLQPASITIFLISTTLYKWDAIVVERKDRRRADVKVMAVAAPIVVIE